MSHYKRGIELKSIFILLIAFLNLFLLISCNNKQNYESYLNKTVEIECEYNNTKSYATGFFINNDGLILTNKHVVNNLGEEYKINIRLNNNDIKNGTIYNVSNDYDLALIKIDYECNYFNFEENFIVGDNVYSIGNPKGYGLTLYEGIVSSNLKIINYNNESILSIQTNIEIYDGCSGGPLINKDGNVLGIMTFRIKDNLNYIPGLSYGIPSKIINEYLNNI